MERVLVGFITYAGAKYCREIFVKSIMDLTYPSFDVVAVTNSGEEDKKDLEKQLAPLKERGCAVTVIVNDKEEKKPLDQVVSNRNILRDYFLSGDWSWLFSLDNDVTVPSDTIERLFVHKKDLISGVYLAFVKRRDEDPISVLPCVFISRGEKSSCQAALIDVLQPRLMEAVVVGFGCTLIKRKYLEAIPFRRYYDEVDGGKVEESTEDTAFFLDCKEKFDEIPWVDTRVRCKHYKYPLDDKRNSYLDPDCYQINVKKKE
ncbi:hypothetical protein GOV10_01735 [Candidatus Woesearchaeota archaeon]|nr:hypothetical protein [Candidatus Woesearchaeota archaeon]